MLTFFVPGMLFELASSIKSYLCYEKNKSETYLQQKQLDDMIST